MKTYEELEKFIEGKNVALIGNAKSIFKFHEWGSFIDKHDIVIRLNFAYPYASEVGRFVSPKYLGTKTTFVFASNAVRLLIDGYRTTSGYPGMKRLVHMSGGNRNSTWRKYSDEDEFLTYPKPYWTNLKNVLTSRPSAGIMAFDILERSNPLKVNMFGFDWKETVTYYNDHETVDNPVGPHDWVKEKHYILGKVKQLGWDIL